MTTTLPLPPAQCERACVCVIQDGRILMTPTSSGRWTLPGGRIEPGETPTGAAVREAWEESGARVELHGEPFALVSPSGRITACFVASARSLQPSPERRPRLWIDPLDAEWDHDHQIGRCREVLRGRGLL